MKQLFEGIRLIEVWPVSSCLDEESQSAWSGIPEKPMMRWRFSPQTNKSPHCRDKSASGSQKHDIDVIN